MVRTAARGEVVVLTGASAGVGRAVARMFAKRGARLGLIARGVDRLRDAADEARSLGGAALVLPADVADAEQVRRAADAVAEAFGPPELWINNAMVSVFSPVRQMRPEEYRRVTDVTYLGAVHGTLAALEHMLPRNRGTIVQVGSALAYRAIPLQSAYCAAKHALQGFTESLRCELLHDRSNVKLTMVHLPAINTPQFIWSKSRMPRRAQPVPPIYQPEVAARAILWAADHPHRRELSVAYPTLKAIYGNRIAPAYADRWLARTGYGSQMTDEPGDPARPHNLWEPVPGRFGAHGEFDDRSISFSPLLWANTHRATTALALGGIAAAVAGVWLSTRRTNALCDQTYTS